MKVIIMLTHISYIIIGKVYNKIKKKDTKEKKEAVEQINGKLKDLIDKYQKKATN